ncbi:MAG: hypothetical protein FWE50_04440, partial [Alphaproteobacteria bacterium]|nr:hypothetical protein [Alphaproteobacteria bacterium]
WNAFLREVAPTLKSAELVAESNRRQNCIGNISECFQKGCKDTIDPKDPEGSFDMCLTRPAAMINICKVQLDECGIPTGSAALAEKHEIWGFVVQRLATMRVDSCTKAIKGCLQDEDRCGDNYIKCAGLTPEIVLKMCPADKMMVSCSGQTINGETITRENVQDKVEEIIYALMNNIRNESFDQCQALAEAKMEEVCGSTTRCDKIFEDSEFGTGGLQLTRESDAMSIIGIVNFGGFKITPTSSCCSTAGSCTPMTAGGSCASPSVERYTGITLTEPVCPTGKTCNHLDATKQSVKEIEAKAQRFINYLLNDTNIGYCMNGREVRGVGKSEAQFPTILNPFISSIIDDAKARAQQNYTAKYDRLLKEAEAKAAELGAKKASNGLCYDADVMSTMKEDKKDAE